MIKDTPLHHPIKKKKLSRHNCLSSYCLILEFLECANNTYCLLGNYFMPDPFPGTFHGFSLDSQEVMGQLSHILQIKKRGPQRLNDLSQFVL